MRPRLFVAISLGSYFDERARLLNIVAGKRAISADTDLRLCRFLAFLIIGCVPRQLITVVERALGTKLAKIKPWEVRRPMESLTIRQ
ncbi:MAG: hypothetical protein ACREV9_01530 [Burkholderiales bacterium]